MPRRSSKAGPPEQTSPSVTPAKGIELLQRQVEAGKGLVGNHVLSDHEFDAWTDLSEQCVIRAFGRNSDRHYSFLNSGRIWAFVVTDYADPASKMEDRRERLRDRVANLESSIEVLKLDIELEGGAGAKTSRTDSPVVTSDTTVFLVHGHDHAALHAVARFIEQLGLVPVVLHEQPNKGRTVIEKFVANSIVGFAVVLLTPDDLGRSVDDDPSAEKPRSRQNVILELGYFLGTLGRDRVCPLCVPGVEIPSDYLGTAYTTLDAGGAWKLLLARELKAAGFAIDLNRAM